MRLLPLLSLVLVASSAACGGDNGTIALDQLPTRIASSFCANAFKCCDAAEIMTQFNGFDPPITTEAECTAQFTPMYQALLGGIDEAITAGRIGYDGGAAADCLAQLDDATCAGSLAARATCDGEIFVGKVAIGAPCKNSSECAGADRYCDGATETDFGACAARAPIGSPCAGGCVDGAYCDFEAETCRAEKADGVACEFGDECASSMCGNDGLCMAEAASTRCDGV